MKLLPCPQLCADDIAKPAGNGRLRARPAENISGCIMFDETIRQKTKEGKPFVKVLEEQGVIPGIKVDKGAKALPFAAGEKVTEGLDGLRDRLAEYSKLGAEFARVCRKFLSLSVSPMSKTSGGNSAITMSRRL